MRGPDKGCLMDDRRRFLTRTFRLAAACVCCSPVVSLAGETHGPHWSYEGEGGPEHWGALSADFRVCELGVEQTPVDLAGGVPAALPQAVGFDWRPVATTVRNNGHTIQVDVEPGCTLRVGGTEYALLQFHFHHPSEHLLSGKAFDLECHFVHKAASGALAVVGVFIRPGAENKALSPIWSVMPAAEGEATGPVVDPAALLPSGRGYFRYMGSLTTPPCSEGLTWTVLKEPVEASTDQIRRFASLFANNARPVQPLNRRFLLDVQG